MVDLPLAAACHLSPEGMAPPRIVLIIIAFNEERKLPEVLRRVRNAVHPSATVARVEGINGEMIGKGVPIDEVVVVDDGSTDGTAEIARAAGATLLQLPRTLGAGAAVRCGLTHARRRGAEIALVMAGNNKDEPLEIPRLLAPIERGEADFVIGSRYLPGGKAGGPMPLYRRWATRLHPFLMSLATRKRLTESTNGFRALRLAILDHPGMRLEQSWLDGYGLEVYLLFKVIRLGFRHVEVPCTKLYPQKHLGQTKMRPITGWWDMLRPVWLLGLGLKR